MKRQARKALWVDRFHKGFVYTCIAVTIYGTACFGARFVRYFTVTKPERERLALLEKQNLLAEGAHDKLQDVAKELRA